MCDIPPPFEMQNQSFSPQLVAPKPLKARRHQKSIISLENFNTSLTTPSSMSLSTATLHTPLFRPESSSDYTDIIPFPSFDSSNEPTPAPSSSAATSSSRFYRATSVSNKPTPSLFNTRPKSMSRKSSLLESWEYQNIVVSGNHMVGDTNVSVLMPATGQSIIDSASVDEEMSNDMHTIPIYNPVSDAVSELFQIMKHTSLSTPASTAAGLDQGDFDHFYAHGQASYEHSMKPRTPSIHQYTQNQNQFASWGGVPPSPVARNTRNPIILNNEFQEN